MNGFSGFYVPYTRNTKYIQNSQIECFKRIIQSNAREFVRSIFKVALTVSRGFWYCECECVSDFDIRVSDLFHVFLRKILVKILQR